MNSPALHAPPISAADLGGIKIEQVVVTPALARRWLEEHNTHNRRLRQPDIDKLARQMAQGRFPVNGDTVRFDVNNVLLDGQHRLHAIVKSGVTVTMLVVTGLPPEVQTTIDQGNRRSASDALTLAGQPYATAQAALAALSMRAETNVSRSSTRPANGEILAYVESHPEILQSAAFATLLSSSRGYRDIPQTLLAYTHMVLSRLDKTDAEDLWITAAELVPVYPGDPAIALARRLAELRRNKSRQPEPVMIDLVFRAWNKRRKTAQLMKLPLRDVKTYAEVTQPR